MFSFQAFRVLELNVSLFRVQSFGVEGSPFKGCLVRVQNPRRWPNLSKSHLQREGSAGR